jgi:hypothetical protein
MLRTPLSLMNLGIRSAMEVMLCVLLAEMAMADSQVKNHNEGVGETHFEGSCSKPREM